MKKITLLLAYVIFMVVLFTACQKNEAFIEKEKKSAIKVENGRLSFESDAQFKAVFDKLMENQSTEYLDKWEKGLNNFKSMKTAYNNLTENDFEKIAKSPLNNEYSSIIYVNGTGEYKEALIVSEHPIFSRLFNNEGFLIIGRDAYRIEKDRTLKIINYTNEKIEKVKKGEIDSEIIITQIKKSILPSSFKNARPDGTLDWSNDCHNVYDGNRAFKASFTLFGNINIGGININGVFSHIIATSQHRKRTLGIWFANDAPVLTLSGNLNAVGSGGGQEFPNIGSITQYNSSEVGTVYFFNTGWSYVSGSITSSGTGDDNQQHGCSAYKYSQ